MPATKATDKKAIREKVDDFQASGMTALYDGVRQGAEELEKFLEDNSVNRVILLSDGQANIGPKTPAELGALGTRLAGKGISVTTICHCPRPNSSMAQRDLTLKPPRPVA